MSHLNFFGLSNFKVFKDQTDFELKPITLLTGTNSSGKSSLIKGLKTIKHAFDNKTFNPNTKSKGHIDLSFLKEINLSNISSIGSFTLIKTENSNNKEIKIRLPFNLPYQFEDMIVELSYISDKTELDNAKLNLISIFLKEEEELLIKFSPLNNKKLNLINPNWVSEINIPKLRELKWKFINKLYKYEGLTNKIINELSIDWRILEFDSLEFLYGDKENLNPLRDLSKTIFKWNSLKDGMQRNTVDFENGLIPKDIGSTLFSTYRNSFIFPFPFLFNNSKLELYLEENEVNSKNRSGIYNFINYYNKSHDKYNIILDLYNAETEFLNKFFKVNEPFYSLTTSEYNRKGEYELQNIDVYDSLNIFGSGIKKTSSRYFNNEINIILNRFQKKSEPKNDDFIDESWIWSEYRSYYKITKESILNNPLLEKHKIDENSFVFIDELEKNNPCSLMHFFDGYIRNGIDTSFLNLTSAFGNMHFIPNIRSSQVRLIGNNDQDYMGIVIKEFNGTIISEESTQFLKKYVIEFELADDIHITYDKNSLTTSLMLVTGRTARNIIDLGFGTSQLLPILIKISLLISKNQNESNQRIGSILVIEEPETNLHPKLQSKLADLFVEIFNEYKIQTIVETHSEYLIRKLQFLTAKNKIKENETNIYYFNKPDENKSSKNQVYEIKIDSSGALSRTFGKGFFDESENIAIDLFHLNMDRKN